MYVLPQISYVLLQFDYFVCPIDYDEVKGGLSMECERSFAFRLHEYSVPSFVHSIGALVLYDHFFPFLSTNLATLFCNMQYLLIYSTVMIDHQAGFFGA